MKRHCENRLRLEGDETDINLFVTTTKKEREDGEVLIDFSLERYLDIPFDLRFPSDKPEEKQQLIKKYGYDNLGLWCMANWGTADLCVRADYDDSTHNYTFITWNAPPSKAIVALSKQFPRIKFVFEYKSFQFGDEAVADSGRFECKNGKIESEEYSRIKGIVCPRCKEIAEYIKL